MSQTRGLRPHWLLAFLPSYAGWHWHPLGLSMRAIRRVFVVSLVVICLDASVRAAETVKVLLPIPRSHPPEVGPVRLYSRRPQSETELMIPIAVPAFSLLRQLALINSG